MAKLDENHVFVSSQRLEEIVTNALEWAIEVDEQIANDLVRGMGITSDELDAIGYDVDNFSSLHRATGIEEIRAVNIQWDADEDDDISDIPTSVVIPEDITKSISDWLSDEYYFCHAGYEIVCLSGDDLKEEEEVLKKTVIRAGEDAVEDFLGHPLDSCADDDMWSEMNDCIVGMPDEEYLKYLEKYQISTAK